MAYDAATTADNDRCQSDGNTSHDPLSKVN